MYDYCFIGAGISVLYCAYHLKKKNPTISIVILEKENRIGGRVYPVNFDGTTVLMGSGVGRMATDILLLEWLIDLGIEIVEFKKEFENQDSDFLKSCIKKLQKNKENYRYDRHLVNFQNYATSILGAEDYEKFKSNASFTDFEEADFLDTVDCYGFIDLIPVGTNYSIPWKLVLEKAIKFIGIENFILNAEVFSISSNKVNYKLKNLTTKNIEAKKIISCCPVPVLKKLYPENKLLDNIGTQTFMRIYAYLDKPLPIQNYYVTHNILQKIIPINPDRNLYMIAYSDNKYADKCNELTKKELEQYLDILFDGEFKIRKMKKHYWEVGTHFFYPLEKTFSSRDNYIAKVQNKIPNHWVIGEAFSNNQGWCEGALESVASIIN